MHVWALGRGSDTQASAGGGGGEDGYLRTNGRKSVNIKSPDGGGIFIKSAWGEKKFVNHQEEGGGGGKG